MKIVVGSDHGGFAAKAFVVKTIQAMGHEVADFGCHSTESVDYPDVAQLVADDEAEVARGPGGVVERVVAAAHLAAGAVGQRQFEFGGRVERLRFAAHERPLPLVQLQHEGVASPLRGMASEVSVGAFE